MIVNPHEEQQLADGTNVAAGEKFFEGFTTRILPWYVPAAANGTGNWRGNCLKLRARFDRFIDEFCTVECFLVQSLVPAAGTIFVDPPGILPDRQLLWKGPGLGREPAHLIAPSNTLFGLFPMLDVRGKPLLNSDGKPVAFRLGLNRIISAYAIPDGLRPLPIPYLTQLMGDGKNLLYQLPAEIAVRIWRNWPAGFSQRDNYDAKSLWLDAVFEMSWQHKRGSPLFVERYAWQDNGSIGLLGTGLFPRLPGLLSSAPDDISFHVNGYPRAFYSKISDIARASVAALDELLEWDTLRRSKASKNTSKQIRAGKFRGSGQTVRDFSTYCEGDEDPTLKKRIRLLIDADKNYIIYLDEDLSVEFSFTRQYGASPPGFAEIASEIARLESITAHLVERPWAKGYRRLLGEALARVVGDRNVRAARKTLRDAEAYRSEQEQKELARPIPSEVPSLKPMSETDVSRVATQLLAHGKTTTLDVKNQLRLEGFFAKQKDVSNAMRKLAGHYGWVATLSGNHLIYEPSSKPANNLKSTTFAPGSPEAAESNTAPKIVLVTVNDNETHALLDAFLGEGKQPEQKPIGGVTYNLFGLHGGCRIIHTICEAGAGGIGASQQRTSQAIDHWEPNAVVAVGIAFGMDEKTQKIGDVLVATQAQDYELGRVNEDGTLTPRGDKPGCSDALRNRLRLVDTKKSREKGARWPKVRFGLVLSGQKLVDNLDYRKSLKANFPEAIGGEMEGVGLYASAAKAKVDWIIVKAICDWAFNKNHPKKEAWQRTAAKNAALVLKAALEVGSLYEAWTRSG